MSRSRSISNVARYDSHGRTIEHVKIHATRIEGDEQVHLYIDNGKRQQHYLLTRHQLRELIAAPVLEEAEVTGTPFYRYFARKDGNGGFGVWDRYQYQWAATDAGLVGLPESDAETIALELNK